jgi:MFS family permease
VAAADQGGRPEAVDAGPHHQPLPISPGSGLGAGECMTGAEECVTGAEGPASGAEWSALAEGPASGAEWSALADGPVPTVEPPLLRSEQLRPDEPRLSERLAAKVPWLLRETQFRRYWTGQTVSMFGDQISSIALPLAAVLVLHADAAEMGYLTALIWLPSLLFGLHAGAWVDRRGQRRRTMIAADLGRFALLASLPLSYALGVLTLALLFVIAFAAGTLSVAFNVSDSALFVAIVPEEQYLDGNTLLFSSRALSSMTGPSVGGLLVQALSAPFALAATALSFLGSAFFLHRIRPAEPPPDRGGKGAVTAGARFIARSPLVRASLVGVGIINFFYMMFSALFLLFAVRVLHVNAGEIGLILGLAASGGVIGALLTKRIAGRIGVGWAYTLGCMGSSAPLVLVPLAGGPRPLVLSMLFAAEFLSAFGVMVLDISIGSIFAAVIPAELRSRVSGAFMAVNYGTRPVGAVLGGLLGTLIGLRSALWIATAGGVLGFLTLLPSPLPAFRMPSGNGGQPSVAAPQPGVPQSGVPQPGVPQPDE